MALSGTLTDPIVPSSRAEIERIIGGIQIVLRIFTWGFFLFWFYRAHRNLPALGVLRGRYTSRWSVLLFFVPVVNVYVGYDMVNELWKQSNPDVGFTDDFLRQHASPLKLYSSKTIIVGLWWGFTIASFVVAREAVRASLGSTTGSDYISETLMYTISDALGIVASIMLIVIVKKIDERQEEKHRRLMLRESEAVRDRSIPAPA
jgi:membrane protein implicated in regulation of membrane protease activity